MMIDLQKFLQDVAEEMLIKSIWKKCCLSL